MHKELFTMLAVAAGVVAVGYVMTRKTAAPVVTGSRVKSPETVFNGALPGQPGWGWDYFTDGVSISPDGVYYMNGREVWRPA